MRDPRPVIGAAMVLGGALPSSTVTVIESWAVALDAPIRLAGGDLALTAFRMESGMDPTLLGPDVPLALPAADDRYIRHIRGHVANWRPLGVKSGPNLQWLRTLAAFAQEGALDWLLLLEPDTSPVGLEVAKRMRAVVSAHPDAWVIGATPEASALAGLDPRFHAHLNGVALYHVGDPAFVAFVETVWQASLLWLLQRESNVAFDVMTSPGVWAELPAGLAAGWFDHAARFVASDTLVNASAMMPGQAGDIAARVEADPEVWLLHAKVD